MKGRCDLFRNRAGGGGGGGGTGGGLSLLSFYTLYAVWSVYRMIVTLSGCPVSHTIPRDTLYAGTREAATGTALLTCRDICVCARSRFLDASLKNFSLSPTSESVSAAPLKF